MPGQGIRRPALPDSGRDVRGDLRGAEAVRLGVDGSFPQMNASGWLISVIGRGWSHATTYEGATTAVVGGAALRGCRAGTFRGAKRECGHISGAHRERAIS